MDSQNALSGFLGKLLVLAAVILPVGAVALTAFLGTAGDLSPSNFTLEKFATVLGDPLNGRALFNSLWLAAGAATACVALGFLLAWLQVKSKVPGRKVSSMVNPREARP